MHVWQLLNEMKISMISVGEKVTDTAYVTGLLWVFFFFFAYFVMERNTKFLLKVNEDKDDFSSNKMEEE